MPIAPTIHVDAATPSAIALRSLRRAPAPISAAAAMGAWRRDFDLGDRYFGPSVEIELAPDLACFDTWRIATSPRGSLMQSRLSDRALAIVAGLVKSAKVAPMMPGAANFRHGFMRLDRVGAEGIFYWVAADGSVLKRGRDLGEADDLAPGFVQAMERLGAPRAGLEVIATEPQSCLARVCA
jgi:hypothetical protein